jgi:cytochrome b
VKIGDEMKQPKSDGKSPGEPPIRVMVWDLPTRLFHWLLVIFVIASFVTAKIGGLSMQYHEWSGFAILTLLLFRLAWGFMGSRESRFSTFIKGPSSVVRYAANLMQPDTPRYLGHNPLGGWSIVAMLLSLFLQAGTGLFANDDIFTTGPLYALVSKEISDSITRIHNYNQGILLLLISVHVLAVFFYLLFKRENLITPMITGIKHWRGSATQGVQSRTWVAVLITAIAAGLVYLIKVIA